MLIHRIDLWYNCILVSKYQKFFREMVDENKELFSSFKELHDKYLEDQEKWQEEFNRKGVEVVDKIRSYELRLCSHQDAGQYGKYASNLADKFWEQVRRVYPKIDFVGVQ